MNKHEQQLHAAEDQIIVDPDVQAFLNQKYRPLNEKLAALREIGEKDRIPIILKETESILSILLYLKKPSKILEIGTAIGYSAAFFSYAVPDAEIYTIDNDELCIRAARHNLEAAGASDHVHVLFGDGQEQIEKLRDGGTDGFDFVFIDAAKSHYRRFCESAIEVCRKDALIVSDNILIHGLTVSEERDPRKKHRTHMRKMREYLDFLCTDPRLSTTLMAPGDGLAVSIYHGYNKDHF